MLEILGAFLADTAAKRAEIERARASLTVVTEFPNSFMMSGIKPVEEGVGVLIEERCFWSLYTDTEIARHLRKPSGCSIDIRVRVVIDRLSEYRFIFHVVQMRESGRSTEICVL